MKISVIIAKYKRFILKIRKLSKTIVDKDDKKALKDFILDIAVNGVLINMFLMVALGLEFNLYSWIGYGFGYRFIDKKIIKWFRSIIHKS